MVQRLPPGQHHNISRLNEEEEDEQELELTCHNEGLC